MKLSFDWVIGIVEIDISDCSVEDVNRLVELTETDHPHKTCVVNGTTLMIDTELLEDVFRHVVPSSEVNIKWENS